MENQEDEKMSKGEEASHWLTVIIAIGAVCYGLSLIF